jgi:hypothetical protein
MMYMDARIKRTAAENPTSFPASLSNSPCSVQSFTTVCSLRKETLRVPGPAPETLNPFISVKSSTLRDFPGTAC